MLRRDPDERTEPQFRSEPGISKDFIDYGTRVDQFSRKLNGAVGCKKRMSLTAFTHAL